MSGFHCLGCDRKIEVFGILRLGGAVIGHADGCQSMRVIPIATLCSEPTVIDESDLAPGMVVVAVDADPLPLCVFVCTPDARLTSYGSVWALRMDLDDAAWVAEGSDP